MKSAGLVVFVFGAIAAITYNVLFLLDLGEVTNGSNGPLLMALTVLGYFWWRQASTSRRPQPDSAQH